MSTDPQDSPSPDERRKINQECYGAPKLFSYPEPPAISEEERRRYQEMAERLPNGKRRGDGGDSTIVSASDASASLADRGHQCRFIFIESVICASRDREVRPLERPRTSTPGPFF
jgi:hypothetical protein